MIKSRVKFEHATCVIEFFKPRPTFESQIKGKREKRKDLDLILNLLNKALPFLYSFMLLYFPTKFGSKIYRTRKQLKQ